MSRPFGQITIEELFLALDRYKSLRKRTDLNPKEQEELRQLKDIIIKLVEYDD